MIPVYAGFAALAGQHRFFKIDTTLRRRRMGRRESAGRGPVVLPPALRGRGCRKPDTHEHHPRNFFYRPPLTQDTPVIPREILP
jgi:hypothetical protein